MSTNHHRPDARALQPRPRVLLTGFDPFGGATLNPSWLAVQALHGRRLLGHTLMAARLPTVFGDSLRTLQALLAQHRPALVVCVGQAGGRSALSLERIAINVDDAPIADNAGAQPIDTPVAPGAPAAYFSTLPIKAMRAALRREGLPAEVSQTAGTFVCNHVFYGLMHALATQPELRHTRGGFVHVPWLPEQGTPSMALDDVVRGLRVALRCALENRPQTPELGAGATH
ncbi:MAG: pyroglutamyl-peptidase I [Burkholderiales bacterium RIFCSPHIGHO2_12_FULL_67_38]|nr:MAG: pyroglutamyl-peptidase I [Burkholderiales bacterium RIFCSPLOWO2_02_FULL_67_64]OGB48572.1 MAG: pyroglutamyl-peptidase I [Burkholderiales bacterium RIFCSPHIGHO2_12_FULL_67_38]